MQLLEGATHELNDKTLHHVLWEQASAYTVILKQLRCSMYACQQWWQLCSGVPDFLDEPCSTMALGTFSSCAGGNNVFAARAYNKTAGILAAYPKKVEAGKELKSVQGIGKGSMDKVVLYNKQKIDSIAMLTRPGTSCLTSKYSHHPLS